MAAALPPGGTVLERPKPSRRPRSGWRTAYRPRVAPPANRASRSQPGNRALRSVVVPAPVFALVVEEPARRPVVLRVTAARAVQAGDVLERHEDVPVELHVGDVLDQAVGGEDAVLILAPEEGDLDRLALVPGRVVLHRAEL